MQQSEPLRRCFEIYTGSVLSLPRMCHIRRPASQFFLLGRGICIQAVSDIVSPAGTASKNKQVNTKKCVCSLHMSIYIQHFTVVQPIFQCSAALLQSEQTTFELLPHAHLTTQLQATCNRSMPQGLKQACQLMYFQSYYLNCTYKMVIQLTCISQLSFRQWHQQSINTNPASSYSLSTMGITTTVLWQKVHPVLWTRSSGSRKPVLFSIS